MFAVETRDLTKEYPQGFWRRQRHPALRGLNLRVEPAEVFGLLGPNGAGKSTTLKILLRLIFPTAGIARILGRALDDPSLHARVGYLPENPYFYDHLTAAEFLNYAAELFGLSRDERRRRVGDLLQLVRLEDAQDVPLRKFSKGMVQRLGIAQALVNDPEVVFLDEPMSGLDPLGRREVRDLILQLRAEGKTVFLSTHILSDAEALCDRVAILNRGLLQGCGELRKILGVEVAAMEIVLENPAPSLVDELEGYARSVVRTGDRVRFEVPSECDVNRFLDVALRHRARIVSLNPVKMTLEDYFMSRVGPSSGGANSDSGVADPSQRSENQATEIQSMRRNARNLSARGGNTVAQRREPAVVLSWHPVGEVKPKAVRGLSPTGPKAEGGQPQVTQAPLSEPSIQRRSAEAKPIRAPELQPRPSSSFRRVWAIALHAFRESVRDNVLYSLAVFALLLIGAAILFGSISVGIEQIILVNLSLSAISVIGLVMAVFIGIGLVSKEIERRSINNILSKPVRRPEFILGKYLGLLLTLAVNTAVMTTGFYLAIVYEKRGLSGGDLAALGAVYFIMLQLALVVGLALFFSCLSTPVLSAVYTLAFYVIGNFLGDMRWFGQESGNALLAKTTATLYYLLPNFSDFNFISSVAHGEKVPSYALVSNSLYALLYVTILISATVLVFEEKEFR